MGAFSRPASHRIGPTTVLFLAYLFAPGRHPDRWKRNRSRSHHERRGGRDCGELSRLRRAGWMRQDEWEATYSCFGLPPATTYIVRRNRGTLVLPDVPCRCWLMNAAVS